MIYGQKPPQPAQPSQPTPSRERLELILKNGGDDIVKAAIEQYKLDFTVETSDGTAVYRGEVIPVGQGYLKDTLTRGERHLQSFITVDETTRRMKSDASLIAASSHEVLIVGETGTGKEIIGKSMIGSRTGQIKAVNCGALPELLFESELFGHVRGAFTGADFNKDGLCQEAKDGVMFLDEIGDMPLGVQVKLLRAIQEKRVRKVGATKDEEILCRFVCATHRDIKKMVEDGQFRKDLYARISTLELYINPLKQRKCDVIPITESLPESKAFLVRHREDLEQELLDLSLNVRSLQQYVTRYNVLGRIKID